MQQEYRSDKHIKRLLVALLRRNFLRSHLDDFIGTKKRRSHSVKQKSWIRFAPSIAVGLILIANFWFMSSRIAHYFSWPFNAYDNPKLHNLTEAATKWDVYYGHSKKCGTIDCHLKSDYGAENYKKTMILPAREFPLKDYLPGQLIYLRTSIQIPESLMNGDEPIVFHSLYIWAKRYSFYVNENLINEGTASLVNISIPRDFIPADRVVNLAFKIDPGSLPYQGLANRADLFLGPNSDLHAMAFAADELKTTYYLWFLLPTITLSIVFIFLFLMVSRKPGSFAFIMYSFLTSVGIFCVSAYPDIMLPWISINWNNLEFVLQSAAMIFLLNFVHDFFYEQDQAFKRITMWGLVALVIGASLVFTLLPSKTAADTMQWVVIILRETTVLYGAYIALLSCLYFAAQGQPQNRIRVPAFLFAFFVFSCLIITFWAAINAAMLIFGDDKVPTDLIKYSYNTIKVFDLAFFVIMAALNAMEVGASMARKEYIEKELQDAANMAQAFQPDADPNWPGMTVDIFHRPLSEASGDWFAFKTSASGRFYHYLLADITGHGIQAALVVSTAKTILNQLASSRPEILESELFVSEYMQALGHILFLQGQGQHTVTLLGLSFDASTETLHFVSAGHPFPLLVTNSGDASQTIKPLISRSKLLGSSASVEKIVMQKVAFGAGCQLISYTDGLPLKMSQSALQQTFAAALKDQKISAEMLFKATWDMERVRSGRRPDDDASVVIFIPAKGSHFRQVA